MSTAVKLPLMTAQEFFQLADPIGEFTYELHFGELIEVGRPKKKHYDLQCLIRDLLLGALGPKLWKIDIEMPYGLTVGYDVRAADVGVCLRTTWDAIPDQGYLIGSPDLVVQVKSRSNRDLKMEEDALVHITHGASAVWLVKPERQEIVFVTSSSRTVHGPNDLIQLPAPLSASVALDQIFQR